MGMCLHLMGHDLEGAGQSSLWCISDPTQFLRDTEGTTGGEAGDKNEATESYRSLRGFQIPVRRISRRQPTTGVARYALLPAWGCTTGNRLASTRPLPGRRRRALLDIVYRAEAVVIQQNDLHPVGRLQNVPFRLITAGSKDSRRQK